MKPQMMNNQLTAPTKIPKEIKMVTEKEAPSVQSFGVAGMEGMGGSGPRRRHRQRLRQLHSCSR